MCFAHVVEKLTIVIPKKIKVYLWHVVLFMVPPKMLKNKKEAFLNEKVHKSWKCHLYIFV